MNAWRMQASITRSRNCAGRSKPKVRERIAHDAQVAERIAVQEIARVRRTTLLTPIP